MDKQLGHIIDESVQLELNVGELYKLFNRTFPEDAPFWDELYEEEQHHANLIRKVGGLDFLTYKIIPKMLSAKIDEIREANETICSCTDKYMANPPSREEAFNLALELEDSACEIHYQEFMENELDDMLTQTFQKLNADDKNHFLRIRAYMTEHGIKTR
ncbi:rubrerythrin family protein [Candidatus Latescibacterota bacterium]